MNPFIIILCLFGILIIGGLIYYFYNKHLEEEEIKKTIEDATKVKATEVAKAKATEDAKIKANEAIVAASDMRNVANNAVSIAKSHGSASNVEDAINATKKAAELSQAAIRAVAKSL